MVYLLDYQNDRAIEDFTQVIRLTPEDSDAYFLRGNGYASNGHYDQAINEYNESLRLKPDNAWAFYYRGNVYEDKGQTGRAIEDYSHVTRLKPDFPDAYLRRGYLHYVRSEFALAIRDYDHIIRLKPEDTAAKNNLAWILATANDVRYRDGQRALGIAHELSAEISGNPNLIGTLAAAYAAVGDFPNAIRHESDAMTAARENGSNLAQHEERLRLYQSGQALSCPGGPCD